MKMRCCFSESGSGRPARWWWRRRRFTAMDWIRADDHSGAFSRLSGALLEFYLSLLSLAERQVCRLILVVVLFSLCSRNTHALSVMTAKYLTPDASPFKKMYLYWFHILWNLSTESLDSPIKRQNYYVCSSFCSHCSCQTSVWGCVLIFPQR